MSASKATAPGIAPDSARSRAAQGAALSADVLARQLQRPDVELEVIDSTASTHTDLIARARIRAPLRVVLRAATRQSAGRGRQGRAWHSSDTGSLLFSLALPWRPDPTASAAVGLACGLAVAECLHAHGVQVQLKWPNDVLLGGGKLAGILTEIADDARGARTLVISMGMNLVVEPLQRLIIEQPVAELAQCLGRESLRAAREQWLACLASTMIDAARQFEDRGFASLRQRFNARFAFLGQPVVLRGAEQAPLWGIARGVDEQGRLLLECEGGLHTLVNGQMSLRAVRAGNGDRRESP